MLGTSEREGGEKVVAPAAVDGDDVKGTVNGGGGSGSNNEEVADKKDATESSSHRNNKSHPSGTGAKRKWGGGGGGDKDGGVKRKLPPVRPERARRLRKRRIPFNAPRLEITLTEEEPCVLLLAPGASHFSVVGDEKEGQRVYRHMCTGKGEHSRGGPSAHGEKTFVHPCDALALAAAGLAILCTPQPGPAGSRATEEAAAAPRASAALSSIPDGHAAISVEAAFRRLRAVDTGLATLTAAHAHLARSGWIVRAGVKFGADFNVYTDHPARVHAAFTVVVLGHDAGSGARLEGHRALNWATLTSWLRVATTTVKDLLTCHVMVPAGGCDALSYEQVCKIDVRTVEWSRESPKIT